MKKKIAITLITLFLITLPFLVGTALGKYSPYATGNSFQTYVILCIAISIAFITLALLTLKYVHQSVDRIMARGVLLFLIVCPIIGILGLASGPDLGLTMLEHPEREHLRYIFLFISAILFGCFFLFLFGSNPSKMKSTPRWIMAVVVTLAFAEFIWEFSHHYSYPEALKEWINQGKNVEDFIKYYDNTNTITIGVLGRCVQFISTLWLSLYLYKLRQIKIWSPIITSLFSILGVVSATVIYITNMNLPKGFEFLFLFFIPGIPFLLFYWIGVALLTTFRKREAAS